MATLFRQTECNRVTNEGVDLMLYQKFLTPGFLYAPFVGGFVFFIVLAFNSRSICVGVDESNIPLYGIIICFNSIVSIRLVTKIDPGLNRVRGSIIFTALYVWFFIFMLILSANFISPFVFDIFCYKK